VRLFPNATRPDFENPNPGRSRRSMRQRVSILGLFGALLTCGCSGADGTATSDADGPIAKTHGALEFSDANNYTETRGLPAIGVNQIVTRIVAAYVQPVAGAL
jgi:hypothetical protein